MADRAYILEQGRVVLEGTSEELLSHPDVARGYLGGARTGTGATQLEDMQKEESDDEANEGHADIPAHGFEGHGRCRRGGGFGGRASAADPIKIGLSAAFSGPNAAAGQALSRGAELAMDEINAAGGVLGRQLASSSATTSTSSIAALPRRVN